jgi:hypothetical protein
MPATRQLNQVYGRQGTSALLAHPDLLSRAEIPQPHGTVVSHRRRLRTGVHCGDGDYFTDRSAVPDENSMWMIRPRLKPTHGPWTPHRVARYAIRERAGTGPARREFEI